MHQHVASIEGLTNRFQLFHLFLGLEVSKLLQEGEVGGEGVRLQEVEEAKELLDAVLQWSAGQQHPVLHAEALEPLQKLAVPVLQAVGLIDDHQPPLDVLELTVIS